MTLAAATTMRSHAQYDRSGLLRVALLVGGSCNGFAVRALESWQLHGPDQLLLGISPFELIAMFVGARLVWMADQRPLAFGNGWAEAVLAAALLIPSSACSWFAVAGYATIRAVTSQNTARLGYVLFAALAVCSLWTSVLLKVWAGPAAWLDAHFVWALLAPFRSDFAVSGNVVGVPTVHNLIIMTACTSASLAPKAILGLAALNLLAGGELGRRFAAMAVAALVVSIAINLLRLALMASSPDLYALIHGPMGANGFDALQSLAVVCLSLQAAKQ